MLRFPSLLPLLLLFSSNATQSKPPPPSSSLPPPQPPSLCNERCGDLQLPFPFHINSTCGPTIDAFHLSCRKFPNNNKHLLFLTLNHTDLLVLDFFPNTGTLLVDFPRDYFRVNESILVNDTPFFGVLPADNVVRLYDCEDSTVCKLECFGGNGCCYPLKDGSLWGLGDGFSVFSQFGCRGFTTWVVVKDSSFSSSATSGLVKVVRGLEIEWAVPWRSGDRSVCAERAAVVNATAVGGGVRCQCADGFAGDGFADGIGCLKSCVVDGRMAYVEKCCSGWHCRRGASIVIGMFVAGLSLAAFAMLCTTISSRCGWQFKRAAADCRSSSSLDFCESSSRRRRSRVFTYQELSKATGGFSEDRKLFDDVDETVHLGEVDDGFGVAVQKLTCQTENVLLQVLDNVGKLSHCFHKNVSPVIGYCINPNRALLVVHEFTKNGMSLEDRLVKRRSCDGLDWSSRLNVAVEAADALAWMQSQVHPQLYVQDFGSSDIFLDNYNNSPKLNCFKLLSLSRYLDILCSTSSISSVIYGSHAVYDFGLLLLEMVVGSRHEDLPKLVWPKMCSGQLEEVVDPFLCYGDLPSTQRKQIESVTDLATQCLLCGQRNNGISMDDVVKQLLCIVNDDIGSCGGSSGISGTVVAGKITDDVNSNPALEVTFSDSSLLQMISVSPDKYLKPKENQSSCPSC